MIDNARSGYEEHLRKLMAAEDTLVLVALDEGNVVGYSVAEISKSSP